MSTTRPPRRRLLSASALGVALAIVPGGLRAAPKPARAKPAATLPPDLVHKLQQIRALTADFREEKKMAILVAPIVRTGTLAYEAPGRLAQQVARPTPSRLVLAGKLLTMTDAGGGPGTVIDIDKQPAVGLLVRLLLGVLAGDVAALDRHARLAFTGGPKWTLELTPTDPLLQKLIKSMRVVGRGAIIDLLTLVDRSGDVTTTHFSNVKLMPGFTEAERLARFGP